MRIAIALAAAALVVGCGGGEARFDADSLVAELDSAGVELELGEPLDHHSGEAREVTLAEGPEDGDDAGTGEHGHEHGGGALIVLDDEEAAIAEIERCEGAVSFTCFRAANAVLRFSELTAAETARLSGAFTAIGDEAD